jgi:hypothetical protein
MTDAYNPLDKLNLGKSVVEALLETPATSMEDVSAFGGAGIYAIYYHGLFQPYGPIAAPIGAHELTPIYVGKAVPSGARKGANLATSSSGKWLYNRISDHRDSIRAAQNLESSDFSVRFLVVDDIWIPLGEALLISMYYPVWNQLIDGFGNHDPGAGRYNGLRPLWDVLHPGRSRAEKCKARPETSETLASKIAEYFSAKAKSD